MTDLSRLENPVVERDGTVAIVTVNRPKVLNALNTATLDELITATAALRDDRAVRCLIITGAGESRSLRAPTSTSWRPSPRSRAGGMRGEASRRSTRSKISASQSSRRSTGMRSAGGAS